VPPLRQAGECNYDHSSVDDEQVIVAAVVARGDMIVSGDRKHLTMGSYQGCGARRAAVALSRTNRRHPTRGKMLPHTARLAEGFGKVRLRSRFARLRRTRFALSVLRGCATRSPQGESGLPAETRGTRPAFAQPFGKVRLRSRFARLRRTRFALSVLRGRATHSPKGRSVVPLAGVEEK